MQKNGTSQLGITLGYNTDVQSGGLHVCEVCLCVSVYCITCDVVNTFGGKKKGLNQHM